MCLWDMGNERIAALSHITEGSLPAYEARVKAGREAAEAPGCPGGCDGCGKCVSSCLYGAMTMEAGKIVLDAARGTGCGMCEAICPETALEMRW